MDIHILVAAHMRERSRPPQMSASAEDRYYNDQIRLWRLGDRLFGPVAAAAKAILSLADGTVTDPAIAQNIRQDASGAGDRPHGPQYGQMGR